MWQSFKFFCDENLDVFNRNKIMRTDLTDQTQKKLRRMRGDFMEFDSKGGVYIASVGRKS